MFKSQDGVKGLIRQGWHGSALNKSKCIAACMYVYYDFIATVGTSSKKKEMIGKLK
jgi:hypothetical protein